MQQRPKMMERPTANIKTDITRMLEQEEKSEKL